MSEDNYEMREHAVGERFCYGDITLEVKEAVMNNMCNMCKGCYFSDRLCGHIENCLPSRRRDQKCVIFVEVKDTQKKRVIL